jgi:hypothetical protein
MINKRDKNSSGKEAESERPIVATSRVAPTKPDPLTAPTALQPSCRSHKKLASARISAHEAPTGQFSGRNNDSSLIVKQNRSIKWHLK